MPTAPSHPPGRALRGLARMVLAAAVALGLLVGSTAAASARETGIDVSRWQHSTSLNWAAVASDGVEFAFIKATEGTTYTNPYFVGDWAASRDAGLYHGAYHFARPSKGTAAAQARYFVEVAGLADQPGDLPPVLDLEATGGLGVSALRTWTRNWLETVEELTGRTPVLYFSPSFWETNLGNSSGFTRYPLWIAHYRTATPRIPGGWPTWTFWQTSSTGRVNGISGNVDTDLFNGTPEELARLAQAATQPALTLAASSAAGYAGTEVGLTGALTDPDTGAALGGRTVTLSRRADGERGWTAIGTATTDALGGFAVSATIQATARYRVSFAGEKAYLPAASPAVTLTLLPPQPTALALAPDPQAGYGGDPVILTGTLELVTGAPVPDQTVRLYRKGPDDRRWRRVGTARTDAAGGFAVPLAVEGTARYQARFTGGPVYTAAASSSATVTLLPPEATTLTLAPNHARRYAGQRVVLTGALLDAGGGPVTDRVVRLDRLLPGDRWRRAANLRTDESGRYRYADRLTADTRYRVHTPGSTRYQEARPVPVTVALRPPRRTRLVLDASRSRVRAGHRVRLTGQLELRSGRALPGHRVRLQRKRPGHHPWRTLTVLETRPDGSFRLRVVPHRDVVYRAVSPGSGHYRRAGARVPVDVR